MEQRDSFIFYRSFYDAVSQLKPKDQVEVFLAICEYALNGTERKLTGVPSAIFMLAKPNLDANQRRFENGKKGGRKKTKVKPNNNLTETKTEPNVDVDVNEDVDEGCKCEMRDEDRHSAADVVDMSVRSSGLGSAVSFFLDRIEATPSHQTLELLADFERELGPEVCIRAMMEALEKQKANWSYIHGILRNKRRDGIRSLAAWDAHEAERTRQRPHSEHQNAMGDLQELYQIFDQEAES